MNFKMQSQLDEMEHLRHDVIHESFKMALKNGTEVELNPYRNLSKEQIAKLPSQSEFGISDEDVQCYKDRYADVAQLGSAAEVR